MEGEQARARPVWWGELLAVAFLLVVYDRVADLAHLRVTAAVARGRQVLRLESLLHVAVERPLDHVVAAHRLLGQGLSLYYDLAHGTVTVAVLVAGWVAGRGSYRRARRVLVAVNLGALAAFVLVPVAPPRLLPGAGFVDVVAGSGTWGAWSSDAASVVARHSNEYASLPSLHVAWALWVVLAVRSWTRSVRLRALAAVHLLLTVAVVLLTGNHYVADVVAGAALTAALWLGLRDRSPRAPAPAVAEQPVPA